MTSLLNTPGATQERFVYDPYGNVTFQTPIYGTLVSLQFDWTHLFASYSRDATTSLSYSRFRTLSSLIGRWISRDPVSQLAASDYSYVDNRPLSAVDPFGLIAVTVTETLIDPEKYPGISTIPIAAMVRAEIDNDTCDIKFAGIGPAGLTSFKLGGDLTLPIIIGGKSFPLKIGKGATLTFNFTAGAKNVQGELCSDECGTCALCAEGVIQRIRPTIRKSLSVEVFRDYTVTTTSTFGLGAETTYKHRLDLLGTATFKTDCACECYDSARLKPGETIITYSHPTAKDLRKCMGSRPAH